MKQIEWFAFLYGWGRRVAAIGFILLIILGNIWATMMITNSQIPIWLYETGLAATGVAILGGLLLLTAYLLRAVTFKDDL